MKKLLLCFSLFIFSFSLCNGQGSVSQAGATWLKAPFDSKIFIENRGQFTVENPGNEKILFRATIGKTELYFTPHGLIYHYTHVRVRQDKDKDGETGPESTHFLTPDSHTGYMQWLNANPNVTIDAGEEQPDYYAYEAGETKKTIRANAFKKLTYHNIYPGIDAEYFFPEQGNGIRYELIIHPGADASMIKMQYNGFLPLTQDKAGNLIVQLNGLKGNELVDSIPHTFYSGTKETISSSFTADKNIVSFDISNYNKSKEITIDPWVVDPHFTNVDVAFDIAKDLAGNIYVYGGGGNSSAWQLRKFTASGTPVWTFVTSYTSASSWYGDLAVDPAGNSYITEGCCDGIIQKISPSSAVVWKVQNGTYEYWLLSFDCSFTHLYLGCGYSAGAIPAESISHLDTATGAITGSVQLNTNGSEPRDIAWAPNGNLYFLSCTANNFALAVTPAFAGIFSVPSSYNLLYNGPSYADGSNPTSGANGIAAGKAFFCTSDGDSLKKRNLNTGALLASVKIPGGIKEGNSGVYIDACNNVYAGGQTAVYQYDSLLHPITNIATTGPVYCLYPAGNGNLLASGSGFIASLHFPNTPNYSISKFIRPTNCSQCNGAISVKLSLCGQADTTNLTYHWSNGATTGTVTGLCPGPYNVTISTGCSPISYSDTNIVVPSGGGGLFITKHFTPQTCHSTGSAMVLVTGGSSPYTYLWSNHATTDSISGLSGGSYCVLVTDKAGCFDTVCFNIPGATLPTIRIAPPADSICPGGSVHLLASGGKTYSWAPPPGLSCTGCPNPTATPTTTTVYTVIGTDSAGCSSRDSLTIKLVPLPVLTINPKKDSVCAGGSIAIFSSGAHTYRWIPATALSCDSCNNPTATPSVTTTYTVIGANTLGCTDSATATIVITPLPQITITQAQKICAGDSVTLTATGGGAYQWSTGSSNSSITVRPLTPRSYTVTVTKGCSVSATTSVTVVDPSLFACCDTAILYGGAVNLYAQLSVHYKWMPPTGLNCDTCPNVIASPSVTTTYTIIGTDSLGCQIERVLTVLVQDVCDNYYVPNVFTPNGDRVNDLFEVKINDIASYSISIYDRWGQELFSSVDPVQAWNGKTKGGADAPAGVYYYIIRSACKDGRSTEKQGFVQLIR